MTNIPKNDYVNKFKPPPGITYGVHTGDANYKPENPLAWGPKGEWNTKKTFEAVGFEEQAKATMCTLNPQGFIVENSTWESRGDQQESTFRPSPLNVAPRPAGWKPAKPVSL